MSSSKPTRREEIAAREGLQVSHKNQVLAEYIVKYLKTTRDDGDENWLSAEVVGWAIDAFKKGE